MYLFLPQGQITKLPTGWEKGTPNMEYLREALEGNFELLPPTFVKVETTDVYINEEGMMKQLPRNCLADFFVEAGMTFAGTGVWGPAVLHTKSMKAKKAIDKIIKNRIAKLLKE